METIQINEVFGPTIQGEGKSAGREVSFVRTAQCNLQCVWCDTPYTWNWIGTNFEHVSNQKFDKKDEVHYMSADQIFGRLQELGPKSIVISGGEPLIQHRQLTFLLEMLKVDNYWVEVETNGTVYPNERFLELVDQINCSPKLANSKNTAIKREKPEVLFKLAQHPKVNFKFVVSSANDVEEIQYFVRTYKMKEVYLMPLGMTVPELNKTTNLTKIICEHQGFHFSDRIHITKLGGGRGV